MYHAAKALRRIGIDSLQDAQAAELQAVKNALCAVHGIGERTAHMFLMYMGNKDLVKGDIHVCRFVAKALGRKVTPKEAEELVRNTAHKLGVTPRLLDYKAWDLEVRK